ncbi:MAG: sodium/proline symporter PutP [Spirochaetales bacterium]|jgi:sodium/proline symporter|nr:sodium/proline symporter PutP [Spirochaetales bacterium]
MSGTGWIVTAFALYALVMVSIGALFFNKTGSLSDYFLGGRKLNSWVAALSAQASDMSGWLLMGLPGAVYSFGTGQVWIAVGLAIGTMLNWLFVARRLRRYTITSKNAITIPEFFSNRFRDSSHILRVASAVFIIIFFAVYTASGFVACGTLFSQVFEIDYHIALIIGVLVILIYTFLGGFYAVCWTDFIQGMLMLVAIVIVPVIALAAIGGPAALPRNLQAGFRNIFADGSGSPLTGVSIISQLAWGLGYFGMPHILVRFMAIKRERDVNGAAAIAGVWVFLSLGFSVVVGAVGVLFVPDLADAETVFIQMIHKIFLQEDAVVPFPLLGGLFLCGILAAIMSTADSQLLVTASSITGDIYKGSINRKASDKHLVWFSRGAVLFVAILAYLIATDRASNIMGLVSNAWSGFGSAFGALVLLSLYWKRLNRLGAAAGIISGGLMVIVWDYIPLVQMQDGLWYNLGTRTGLYSLVPGFTISFLSIIVVSLLTKKPRRDILEEFERVVSCDGEEEEAETETGSAHGGSRF